ncbi:MAG TPA: thiamine phosphate synthase [Candidatus Binataceae bacterium]|nr:thiamine phosphate synthase [Candidatus Binataceae bacterium]
MADSIGGGYDPADLAKPLLEAGARIIQLRYKHAGGQSMLAAAMEIARMARQHAAIFIVNDRVDIAMLSGADGVHLGQDDLPLAAARKLVGPDKIIGISTHSIEQAREAQAGGADYIGFGPIYPGGLKSNATGLGLDALAAVRAAVTIPIVAIGGITELTTAEVLGAGADAVAIITDIVKAPDPAAKVRSILSVDRQMHLRQKH